MRKDVNKISKYGLKIPLISLFVLVGISAIIFFVTDSVAKTKSDEVEIIDQLDWIIPLGTYEHIEIFENKSGLLAVRKGNHVGIIDSKLNVITPCIYDAISPIGEGKLIRASLLGKEGYLDQLGRVAIPFIYDQAYDFTGEYALVSTENCYKVINTSGEIVYENPKGYRMHPTEKEGLFTFWTGKSLYDEWEDIQNRSYKGLIDISTNSILIEPDTYQETFSYSEGFWLTALYQAKSMEIPIYLVDGSWSEAFPHIVLLRAQPFSGGFAPVEIIKDAENKENIPDSIIVGWGYIDREGNMQENNLFMNSFSPFSEGLVSSFDERSLYFVNTSGEKVFEIERKGNFGSSKEAFHEGLAPVSIKSKNTFNFYNVRGFSMSRGTAWGYVDKSGNFVVPPIFLDAWPVTGGLALVQYDGSYGVISINTSMHKPK